jgi:hypothetical protein
MISGKYVELWQGQSERSSISASALHELNLTSGKLLRQSGASQHPRMEIFGYLRRIDDGMTPREYIMDMAIPSGFLS